MQVLAHRDTLKSWTSGRVISFGWADVTSGILCFSIKEVSVVQFDFHAEQVAGKSDLCLQTMTRGALSPMQEGQLV